MKKGAGREMDEKQNKDLHHTTTAGTFRDPDQEMDEGKNKDLHLLLRGAAVGYNGRALIQGIGIGVRRGEIVTLVGPNGAGKSTILKSITRQLTLVGGEILLSGRRIDRYTPAELAEQMAVVLTGRLQTELMTCRDVAAMGRYPYTGRLGILSEADEEKVDRALAAVHAEHLADRPFDAVSDGERQRILLARAICQEPEIIVLDEPTSYLDIRHKLELLAILHRMAREEGITVVMSLHELELAMKISDRVICVRGEEIFACGRPSEVLDNDTVRRLYDLDPALGWFDVRTGSLELRFARKDSAQKESVQEKGGQSGGTGPEPAPGEVTGRTGAVYAPEDKALGAAAPVPFAGHGVTGPSGPVPALESRAAGNAGTAFIPRFMLAAPGSGSGKTLLTCGLLRLLQRKGLRPAAFKCGPDYIDPMFHRQVLGLPSRNLDTFFSPEGETLSILGRAVTQNRADIAVIEGVMGYFDGTGASGMEASSFDLAQQTDTPVILVVNAKGMSRSIVPVLQGFSRYEKDLQAASEGKDLEEAPERKDLQGAPAGKDLQASGKKDLQAAPEGKIRGVILNRISAGMFPMMKKWIEADTDLEVIGYLPQNDALSWGSRHLGLLQPEEIQDLQGQIDRLADVLEESLDTEKLLKIAGAGEDLHTGRRDAAVPGEGLLESDGRGPAAGRSDGGRTRPRIAVTDSNLQGGLSSRTEDRRRTVSGETRPRIAVARDEAFSFYYEDNLEILRECGADLVFFSPLHDEKLPEADGLLLGGGYPELHARELAENESMKAAVRAAADAGTPVLAECGGFMYLQEYLELPAEPAKTKETAETAGKAPAAEAGGAPETTQTAEKSEKAKNLPEAEMPETAESTPAAVRWPMCGVLPGTCRKTDRLVRFGYLELQGREDLPARSNEGNNPERTAGAGAGIKEGVAVKGDAGIDSGRTANADTAPASAAAGFLPRGQAIRGHEFHYFDSTDNGNACTAYKPGRKRSWDCMVVRENIMAGFPHLYYRSNPEFAARFVEACRVRAQAGKKGKDT